MSEERSSEKNVIKPRLRSLVTRKSAVTVVSEQDPETGEWRNRIKMTKTKFDDYAKGVFLQEFAKWGRMGESAAAAGVTTKCVRDHIDKDEDFAEAVLIVEQEYRDKLIGHHQDLLFNGVEKKTYDRQGNLISEQREYPIRLIELELKKHDEGYRDKQEVKVDHTGGVLVAPAETSSIDDWEKRFGKSRDVTPQSSSSSSLIESTVVDDEEDDD